MASDLIALRTFLQTRIWAMHRPALTVLRDAVLTATDADSLVTEAGRTVQAAARPSRRGTSTSGAAIGILPVFGVITARPSLFSEIFGGAVITTLQAQLREFQADGSIASIVLLFDSPGGETSLLDELAAELRASAKPITAVISPMAASAAFWLAAQARDIAITPSGWAGSIGVYMLHLDHSRLLDTAGITPTFVSAGDGKVDANEMEPLSTRAKADLQSDVNQVYERFVRDVTGPRHLTRQHVTGTVGARLYQAGDALRLRLVDRIETVDDTFARLTTRRSGPLSAQVAADHEAIVAALSGDYAH